VKVQAAPLFPLLLLTLLAGGTFWLERASQIGEAGRNGKNRHDPDFIVEHFTTRRFNLEGHLQHHLSAQKMTHYPDDDTTEVSTPSLIYYGQSNPLHIDAEHAWVSKDGKEVKLIGNVQMKRPARPHQPELLVKTAELRVFPDDEIARTQTAVTIINGLSTLQGQGLEANHHTQIFTLLGRVQGVLQRPAHPHPRP
jgi:lipopolysaccharide export system protein LptC